MCLRRFIVLFIFCNIPIHNLWANSVIEIKRKSCSEEQGGNSGGDRSGEEDECVAIICKDGRIFEAITKNPFRGAVNAYTYEVAETFCSSKLPGGRIKGDVGL